MLTIGKPASWTTCCGLLGEPKNQIGIGRNADVYELNRLWCRESLPRNTESWFIGQVFRHLKRQPAGVAAPALPKAGCGMTLRDKVATVLSNGSASFWKIMAALPGEKTVDVAEALRALRRERRAWKKDRVWRLKKTAVTLEGRLGD